MSTEKSKSNQVEGIRSGRSCLAYLLVGFAQAALFCLIAGLRLKHLLKAPNSHYCLLQSMDHYRLARQLSGVVNGTYVGTVR